MKVTIFYLKISLTVRIKTISNIHLHFHVQLIRALPRVPVQLIRAAMKEVSAIGMVETKLVSAPLTCMVTVVERPDVSIQLSPLNTI